jgi:S-adenosylmethionine:tRNA ribosyltransferase-isomerase
MQLCDFDYHLPPEHIATTPLEKRSASRLMHLDRQQSTITHRTFTDIVSWLEPGDLLVLNNTKVIPARLYTTKPSGGKVTLLISEMIGSHQGLAMIKSNHPLSLPLTVTIIDSDATLTIDSKQGGTYTIRSVEPLATLLETYGHMPLPPYMQRLETPEDKARYQTVYAAHPGAIAAPTAGLHFDAPLLERLTAKGIELAYVTLHVGSGTFQSVRTNDISQHQMHFEHIHVPQTVADQWAAAKARGNRVVAVGTTAVRSLESAWDGQQVVATEGKTNLFITPGYTFHTIDALITNFHLPKSTLLMLTSALAGREFMLDAYQEAIQSGYRFFSYGDAMLIA